MNKTRIYLIAFSIAMIPTVIFKNSMFLVIGMGIVVLYSGLLLTSTYIVLKKNSKNKYLLRFVWPYCKEELIEYISKRDDVFNYIMLLKLELGNSRKVFIELGYNKFLSDYLLSDDYEENKQLEEDEKRRRLDPELYELEHEAIRIAKEKGYNYGGINKDNNFTIHLN